MSLASTKSLKFNEVVSYIEKLPLNSVRLIMDNYAKNHKVSLEDDLNHLTMTDFQKRLEAVGANILCPICKTRHYVKTAFVNIPSVIGVSSAILSGKGLWVYGY